MSVFDWVSGASENFSKYGDWFDTALDIANAVGGSGGSSGGSSGEDMKQASGESDEKWYERIGRYLGVGADFIKENPWLANMIDQGLFMATVDKPNLDVEALKQAGIDAAVRNSPDYYNEFGSSVTVVDPETGKRVNRQEMSPEIQKLMEAMVSRAGGPINTYQAPKAFDEMLGGLIKDRETFQGLPLSGEKGYYRPYDDTPLREVDLSVSPLPSFEQAITEPESGGGYREETQDEIDRTTGSGLGDQNAGNNLIQDPLDLSGFRNWYQNPINQSRYQDGDIGRAISDYVGEMESSDPGWFEQLMVERGPDMAKWGLTLAGAPTAGKFADWLGSKFVDNYWDNNAWASAAPPVTSAPGTDINQGIQDMIDRNDPSQDVVGRSPINEGNSWRGNAGDYFGGRFGSGAGDMGWGQYSGGGGGKYTGTHIKSRH